MKTFSTAFIMFIAMKSTAVAQENDSVRGVDSPDGRPASLSGSGTLAPYADPPAASVRPATIRGLLL
jgi:hypothetical protein